MREEHRLIDAIWSSYGKNRATDARCSEKRGPQSQLGILAIPRNKMGREIALRLLLIGPPTP